MAWQTPSIKSPNLECSCQSGGGTLQANVWRYVLVWGNGCPHYLLTQHRVNLTLIAEEWWQTNKLWLPSLRVFWARVGFIHHTESYKTDLSLTPSCHIEGSERAHYRAVGPHFIIKKVVTDHLTWYFQSVSVMLFQYQRLYAWFVNLEATCCWLALVAAAVRVSLDSARSSASTRLSRLKSPNTTRRWNLEKVSALLSVASHPQGVVSLPLWVSV